MARVSARTMEESLGFGLQRVLDGVEFYIQTRTSAGRVSGDDRLRAYIIEEESDNQWIG